MCAKKVEATIHVHSYVVCCCLVSLYGGCIGRDAKAANHAQVFLWLSLDIGRRYGWELAGLHTLNWLVDPQHRSVGDLGGEPHIAGCLLNCSGLR